MQDYYTQVALLNSLKLKRLKTNDSKAIQEELLDSQVFALLFKTEYSESVKRRLRNKLRSELDTYLKLDAENASLEEAPKEVNLETENITKMLMEIQTQLKPMNQFIRNIQKAPAPSRMSKAEKQQLDEDQLNAAIEAKAMKKLLSTRG